MKIIFFAFTIILVSCSAYDGPYDGLWIVDNSPTPAYISFYQDDFGIMVGIVIGFFLDGYPF